MNAQNIQVFENRPHRSFKSLFQVSSIYLGLNLLKQNEVHSDCIDFGLFCGFVFQSTAR